MDKEIYMDELSRLLALTDKESVKEQIRTACGRIDEVEDELIGVAQYLHDNPELGQNEFKAVAKISQFMSDQGFVVHGDVSEGRIPELRTSLRADFYGPSASFKMAFLGEYDALPELGHGCGHNLISPMSMGAAIGFAAATPNSITTFFGCPAEETIGGKVYMADAGIFAGYDGALLTHPSDANELGGSSLASHPLEVTFLGRAAHIADPNGAGINALDCLVDYYGRVKQLVTFWGSEALVGTIITEGGAAPNIIPDRATLRMTVRAKKVAFLEQTILPALKELAKTCSEDYGTNVEYHHYEPLFKDLVEDKRLQTVAKAVMTALDEPPAILPDELAEGSTDMGNVSQEIPTIQVSLKIGEHIGLHTPEFVAAANSERALAQISKGAKIMAVTAILYRERLLFDNPIK